MKRMNKDGVLLCELQATAFEKSIENGVKFRDFYQAIYEESNS